MHENRGRTPSRAALLLLPIAASYALLAMATPMSDDFILNNIEPIGAKTENILGGGSYFPWHLYQKLFYLFLLHFGLVPVQTAGEVIGRWYFQAGPSSYLLVLALKMPMLVFTLACGIMLYMLSRRLGATADRPSAVMLLWFANPLVVITTVMWGASDVVALFFALLSLMLLSRGNMILSAVSLFAGVAVKVIPIVLLPVYLIYLYRTNVKAFLRFTLASAALLALGVLVVSWLGGQQMIAGVTKQLGHYFPIFAGVTMETGSIFPQLSLTVFGVSLLIVLAARFWHFREHALPDLLLAYLLVFFGLAFWSPPYLIYPMSFLALDCATKRRLLGYVTIVLTAVGTSVIAFGFYFSSWGHSVFFIPNYTAQMQQLSFFILMLPGHPITHRSE